MQKFNRDMIWSVLLCVLSIAIFCYSGTFEAETEMPTLATSEAYSKIWALALFTLSLLLLIRTLRQRDMTKNVPLFTFSIVLSVLGLVLYLYSLDYFGFVPCTVLFLTVMITYYHWLSLSTKGRRITHMNAVALKYFILSLVISGIFYFIFGKVLNVYLPTGSLVESLFY